MPANLDPLFDVTDPDVHSFVDAVAAANGESIGVAKLQDRSATDQHAEKYDSERRDEEKRF
jgi:hypothetical protein